MDVERVRAIVKKLAHVEETVQWGETLVFWVGDKAIGGKMFAVVPLQDDRGLVMSFSAGAERYSELLEIEGVVPAPYMARIHWVALEHWEALEPRELAALLATAHSMTYAKLPQRIKDVLALPAGERHRLIAESRRRLAAAKTAEDARKESSAQVQRAAKQVAGKAMVERVAKAAAKKAIGPAKKKSSRAARIS